MKSKSNNPNTKSNVIIQKQKVVVTKVTPAREKSYGGYAKVKR